MELTPLENELQLLREENRRLKALLELREDNSSIEKYQVASRNKLIILIVFVVVFLGGAGLELNVRKQLNRELAAEREKVQQLQSPEQ